MAALTWSDVPRAASPRQDSAILQCVPMALFADRLGKLYSIRASVSKATFGA